MQSLYESLLRSLLFRMDPEEAHERAGRALSFWQSVPLLPRWLGARLRQPPGARPVRVWNLQFPNRVGMAAGFDKDAEWIGGLASLGFGHLEVGTVTARPQPGNERPRLFRYPASDALINRMGFNNAGAEAMARRLAALSPAIRGSIPIGVNLGKSKASSLEEASEDYLFSLRHLASHASYLVINVSSPNTPGLRELQNPVRLGELLRSLQQANKNLALQEKRTPPPLLIKLAPDLTFRQLDAILETVDQVGLDGIIATNTTLSRPGKMSAADQAGGLSGRPLTLLADDILRYLSLATRGRLPLIASGGVMDGVTAARKLDLGATLVQVYTGLVYRGPYFPARLVRSLSERDRSWCGA